MLYRGLKVPKANWIHHRLPLQEASSSIVHSIPTIGLPLIGAGHFNMPSTQTGYAPNLKVFKKSLKAAQIEPSIEYLIS